MNEIDYDKIPDISKTNPEFVKSIQKRFRTIRDLTRISYTDIAPYILYLETYYDNSECKQIEVRDLSKQMIADLPKYRDESGLQAIHEAATCFLIAKGIIDFEGRTIVSDRTFDGLADTLRLSYLDTRKLTSNMERILTA